MEIKRMEQEDTKLSLNFQQTLLMFSIEQFLIVQDIKKEVNVHKQKLKHFWYKKWKSSIENHLGELICKNKHIELYKSTQEILSAIDQEKSKEYDNKSKLILFEVSIFRPYFEVYTNNPNHDGRKIVSELKSYPNSLELSSKENYSDYLKRFFSFFCVDSTLSQKFYEEYSKSIRWIAGIERVVIKELVLALTSQVLSDLSTSRLDIKEPIAALSTGLLTKRIHDDVENISKISLCSLVIREYKELSQVVEYFQSPNMVLSQLAKLDVYTKFAILDVNERANFFVNIIQKINIDVNKQELIMKNEDSNLNNTELENISECIYYLRRFTKRFSA